MTTQTRSHSRTITGYLLHRLEYARWLIECDTDFTDCPYHGRYRQFVAECETCVFGKGCRWLGRYTADALREASMVDLVEALETAVEYVAERRRETHLHSCACDDCEWLRTSRRFLRSLPG
ncbi:MAG: hypothetical protein ACE5OQ_02175 [Woeseia sp.]